MEGYCQDLSPWYEGDISFTLNNINMDNKLDTLIY